MNIVVDTNSFISALCKDSTSRRLIINSQQNFLFPEFEFDEIEKHKLEILEKSGLSKEEFEILLGNLLKYVKVIKTKEVINYREQAFDIIGKTDEDDVLFIATALAYDATIWSDDKHFQQQKKVKILTTKDMMGFLENNTKRIE
ncbi:PIN domain-containing protein [Candidatus Pacearchaeota archaeon]|nr:PIN domain-containing protein [Candidatus Pacearchaeota archaeon]